MSNDINLVIKDITGSQTESLKVTDKAVFDNMPLIRSIMNAVEFNSGNTLYPYTDIPVDHTVASFVVGGLTIPKTIDISVFDLTDETVEDAAPSVGIREALLVSAGQVIGKKAEQAFVATARADATIALTGPTFDWSGVKATIKDMGASIHNTEGKIIVGMSLGRALDLASSDEFANFIGVTDKVKLVISEFLTDSEMLVFHTHGVAGGYRTKNIEFDREGSKSNTAVVAAYDYGYAWDSKYIRFVK